MLQLRRLKYAMNKKLCFARCIYVYIFSFQQTAKCNFRLDKWIVIIVCVCIVDSIDFFFHKPLMKGPSFFTTRHINFMDIVL